MRSGFTLDGCERWAMMAGTRWADGLMLSTTRFLIEFGGHG